MSNIDRTITNADVIPIIESDLFQDNPTARFAIGILAVGDDVLPGLEREYAGYFGLRKEVYVTQTGQLDQSEICADGTDRDNEDKRSVAFGVIENRGSDQRVVAATRLIIKGFAADKDEQRPLPVEEFCPDIFAHDPAPVGSDEVSRLISRHEKASIQEILCWRIYGIALGYIANHDLGPTLAVIEPWLEKHLNATIPITRIGEPRYIEHYKDYNLPIQVHTDRFVEQMQFTHPGMIDEYKQNEGSMSYFGKIIHQKQPDTPATDRRVADMPVEIDRREYKVSA